MRQSPRTVNLFCHDGNRTGELLRHREHGSERTAPGMSPETEERDDVVLLRAVARGDEESLAVLYDRHAGWLTIRMTRRCALPDVVDHAVQDTFLALWREAGAYRGTGDVAAFIWGIGIRRLIDAIRRESGPRRSRRRSSRPRMRYWLALSTAVWARLWPDFRRSCAARSRRPCWTA